MACSILPTLSNINFQIYDSHYNEYYSQLIKKCLILLMMSKQCYQLFVLKSTIQIEKLWRLQIIWVWKLAIWLERYLVLVKLWRHAHMYINSELIPPLSKHRHFVNILHTMMKSKILLLTLQKINVFSFTRTSLPFVYVRE